MRRLTALCLGMLISSTLMERALADPIVQAPTPKLTHIMAGKVDIGAPRSMGISPVGHRREIPITGGIFEGPDIKATVLPGGSDWQLQRTDGGLEIVAEYTLQTDDGVFIKVLNEGVSFRAGETRVAYTMTTPRFVAPEGKYQWLNEAIFVGTLSVSKETPPRILIDVFRAEPGE